MSSHPTLLSDDALIKSVYGLTAGLSLGYVMTEYADVKDGTIIEDIHHYWIGLIATVCGLILSFTKKSKNIGLFMISLGLGITLTDLRDLGKEVGKATDNEELTKAMEIKNKEDESIIQSCMIPTHSPVTVTP